MMAGQRRQHGRSVAGIDDGGVDAIMDQPQIIVVKCWNGKDLQHRGHTQILKWCDDSRCAGSAFKTLFRLHLSNPMFGPFDLAR